VQLCAEHDKETFPAWCAQQDIEFVTYLNNRFAVVRSKDVNAGKLSAFCFSTPVRVADQHLAFNTNTILVQLKSGMEQAFVHALNSTLKLNKHPFIP
jgi:hypothetical protein